MLAPKTTSQHKAPWDKGPLGMMFTHMVAPKINFEFFIKKAHEERGTEGVCWYKILQAISESMILVPNLLFYALF